MVYSYLSIYLCRRHAYDTPSFSISLLSGMDTYIKYKLQRTLRASKFIIHPFLFVDNPEDREVGHRWSRSG